MKFKSNMFSKGLSLSVAIIMLLSMFQTVGFAALKPANTDVLKVYDWDTTDTSWGDATDTGDFTRGNARRIVPTKEGLNYPATAPMNVDTTNFVLSFDFKAEQTDHYLKTLIRPKDSTNSFAEFALDTNGKIVFDTRCWSHWGVTDTYNSGFIVSEYTANKWYKVDIVGNVENSVYNLSFYLDGIKLGDATRDLSQFGLSSGVGTLYFGTATNEFPNQVNENYSITTNPNAAFWIDNVKVVDYSINESFYATSKNDIDPVSTNEVIEFSEMPCFESIEQKEAFLNSIKVVDTTTNNELKIGKPGFEGSSVNIPLKGNLAGNREYAVVLPENIKSVTGKDLISDIVYFSTDEFSLSKVWDWDTKETEYGVATPTGDLLYGNARKLIPTANWSWISQPPMDANTSDFVLSFEFKAEQTDHYFKALIRENTSNRNFAEFALDTNGKVVFDKNCWSQNGVLDTYSTRFVTGEYTANKWYKVDIVGNVSEGVYSLEFYLDGKLLGTSTTNLASLGTSTTGVGKLYFGSTSSELKNSLDESKPVQPNPNAALWIDNVRVYDITSSSDVKSVSKVRFNNADGEEFGPLSNDIDVQGVSVKVYYNGSVNTENAVLKLSDGVTEQTFTEGEYDEVNNVYTVEIGNVLKSDTKYSVNVSGVEGAYDYNTYFTTKVENVKINSFYLANSNGDEVKTVQDIMSDKKVYLVLDAINPTAETEDITAIIAVYKDHRLVESDFRKFSMSSLGSASLDVSSDPLFTELSLTEGVTVKGFIWNNFVKLQPRTKSLEIK